jgi:hypothetical protein
VIIDDGQRMALLPAGQPDPTLEVHLPELVGLLPLEAKPSFARRLRERLDPVMPAKNPVNGRGRRRHQTLALQAGLDLAGSPHRMGFAHRQHRRLDLGAAVSRAGVRAA